MAAVRGLIGGGDGCEWGGRGFKECEGVEEKAGMRGWGEVQPNMN